MPTVIDSLIIELGLDPTKFTKGQKEAIKSLHEATTAAQKTASAIEDSSKRSAEFLGTLNSRLAALGGLFLGSKFVGAMLNFAGALTKQDAASGRLSYTLGTNVSTLDKWRNAAYLVGGSAEGMTGSIQGLVNQFQDFAITGESSVIPWFRALNVQIADSEGKMRPFEDIMVDLANAFQKLDPVKAAAFGRHLGLDQGTINLLVKGGDELRRVLSTAEQFSNLTPKYVDNATQLAAAWAKWDLALTNVGRSLLNLATPGILDLMKSQTGTFKELEKGQLISPTSLLGSWLYGTKFRGFGIAPEVANSGASSGASGAFTSDAEKEAFIRAEAVKRGIDPNIAMAVARSEGFKDYVGDQGTSFGAFQLHYKNNIPGLSLGGLGDTFTKQTGLDARDPKTEREQIQFALDQASKGGWGPWHGWKGSQWAGISPGGRSEVTIGTINVQTQATDAQGIANSIGPAIKRAAETYHSQGGPQ